MTLSPDDIRFFKGDGYLIKRGVMDPELTARARDRMWAGIPPRFKRDDPDTWTGPFTKEEESEDVPSVRRGFDWKYREPGNEPWIIEMLVSYQQIWDWAEQLLGKDEVVHPKHSRPEQGLPRSDSIRGIYCILPGKDRPEELPVGHVDGGFFHMGIVGIIDHIPPHGGAFTVWPGSHRTLYYGFTSQYKDEKAADFDERIEQVNTRPYVECHGDAGDIVFWHHRLAHSRGHNSSCQIRQAVLYDFRKKDIERTAEEPPQEDMWRDWSEEVRASPL